MALVFREKAIRIEDGDITGRVPIPTSTGSMKKKTFTEAQRELLKQLIIRQHSIGTDDVDAIGEKLEDVTLDEKNQDDTEDSPKRDCADKSRQAALLFNRDGLTNIKFNKLKLQAFFQARAKRKHQVALSFKIRTFQETGLPEPDADEYNRIVADLTDEDLAILCDESIGDVDELLKLLTDSGCADIIGSAPGVNQTQQQPSPSTSDYFSSSPRSDQLSPPTNLATTDIYGGDPRLVEMPITLAARPLTRETPPKAKRGKPGRPPNQTRTDPLPIRPIQPKPASPQQAVVIGPTHPPVGQQILQSIQSQPLPWQPAVTTLPWQPAVTTNIIATTAPISTTQQYTQPQQQTPLLVVDARPQLQQTSLVGLLSSQPPNQHQQPHSQQLFQAPQQMFQPQPLLHPQQPIVRPPQVVNRPYQYEMKSSPAAPQPSVTDLIAFTAREAAPLAIGVLTDTRDLKGNSVLHVLAARQTPRCEKILMFLKRFKREGGTILQSVIDVQNSDGKTALQIATEKGYLMNVGVLLEFGADPTLPCTYKHNRITTPLHLAVMMGRAEFVYGPDILRKMIEACQMRNRPWDSVVDYLGRSLLHLACEMHGQKIQGSDGNFRMINNLETVQLLLECRSDLNKQIQQQGPLYLKTALHFAFHPHFPKIDLVHEFLNLNNQLIKHALLAKDARGHDCVTLANQWPDTQEKAIVLQKIASAINGGQRGTYWNITTVN